MATDRKEDLTPPPPGTLRLVALGGLGEIGMNCLALEQEGGIILIDCGITFPASDLGIDVYHPRFDYILSRRDRLAGVVLTHGHEDHIGALPYLLGALDVPVYGPAHALELARHRLTEHEFELDALQLVPTRVREPFELGPFSIEPIRVTHSIADATALAIRTAAGLVVHTGDFKLDPSPPDGELTDEARFEALGDEGVRLLLSDSTNIDSPGSSASEREVGRAIHELVERARGRVVVGVFASNVQRLLLLGEIALATGRKICLLGRSVGVHTRSAQFVGRIRWPSDLIIPPEVASAMPRERVMYIASGTQAERMSALTRLSMGTHQLARLSAGDTVILSSRIIPGNDRAVFDMMSGFLRLGVELVTRITHRDVHASGHAQREEQQRMLELVRPRSFLPVHGTLHHLMRHAALARELGIDDVLVAENGELVELGPEGAIAKKGMTFVGRVACSGGEELGEEVLRERSQIGRAGVAFVSVTVDKRGYLGGPPQVVMHGVLEPAHAHVLRKTAAAAARAVEGCELHSRGSDDLLGEVVRLAARRVIESHTGRRPLVVVSITRL